MNWKNEAIEKLESYGAMRQSVKSIHAELKLLELEAKALSSPEYGSPLGGYNKRSKEDRLLDNITRRETLLLALEQANLWVAITDEALACLHPQDKQLLDIMYIKGGWGSVAELSEMLGIERSSVYRRRDDALRKFTIALYGQS